MSERNFSLLKVNNYYTAVSEADTPLNDEDITKRGVTYLKFIDNDGKTLVQMSHGDGVTALKDCPSIGYSADGILVGDKELTQADLEKLLEFASIIDGVWTGEGEY